MPERVIKYHFFKLYKAPTGFWQGLRDSFTVPSIDQYVAHLERLEGIEITSYHHIPMTDELCVIAVYSGYELTIDMDWDGDLNLTSKLEVPESIFTYVVSHMKNYSKVSYTEEKAAIKRHIKIAKKIREKNS